MNDDIKNDPFLAAELKANAKDELHSRVRTIDNQIVRLDDEAKAAEHAALVARTRIEALGRLRAEYAEIIRGVE